MAEFQEMVREFHRLCETQRRLNKNICDKCPIKVATRVTMFQCYRYVLEKPKEAENIIMSWAAAHPEPVYETWLEFIKRFEVGSTKSDKDFIYWMGTTSIPPDIAEKLGLQPKQ